MKRFLTFFFLLLAVVSLRAQSEAEQMLVFRHSGDIHLFYTNELDSVVLSMVDEDSVVHDTPVSQVFYCGGKGLSVPIADIDSVTFGSRNVVEYKPNVRVLTPTDSLYIRSWDGTHVYYVDKVPASLLPRKGEVLYYGRTDKLFPVGFAARVLSVEHKGGEYIVTTSEATLADVFERLFYAGRVDTSPERKQSRVLIDTGMHHLEGKISFAEAGALTFLDDFRFAGNVIVNPLSGYYYVNGNMYNLNDLHLQAYLSSSKFDNEVDLLNIPLPLAEGAFNINFKIGLFVDIEAELSASLHMQRKTDVHIEHVRRRNQEPVTKVDFQDGKGDDFITQTDLTCKGEVYAGVQVGIDFNLLLERAGLKSRVRIGPSFRSDFGMGLLQRTSVFNPEIYAKAAIDYSLKLQTSGCTYTRSHILWGAVEEHELASMKYEFNFLEGTIDLFPHFFSTRAVKADTRSEHAVSAATRTTNSILSPVETGFELVDADDEVVDSVYVQTVKAGSDEEQGVAGAFDLRGQYAQSDKQLLVRPVFHYAGHTVRAQSVNVAAGTVLQPVVFEMGNGVEFVLSGYPYYISTERDSTLYTAGNYIPVPTNDTVFVKPHGRPVVKYLEASDVDWLVGTWSDGKTTTWTFRADGSGQIKDEHSLRTFSYYVNNPQSGKLLIAMDDNDDDVCVLTVLALDATTFKFRHSVDKTDYTLTK